MKSNTLKYTYTIATWVCRLLLCATFIFSGLVKVADPMGMVHKLHAYAIAFDWHLADDALLLKVAATALGTIEFVLGVYLLLGIRRKFTTYTTAFFMLTFTCLTAWIYAKNPVPDCGCFGDAIKLTNGQTFAKNIVLLCASTFLLFRPLSQQRIISEHNAWILSIYSWGYAIGLAIYTLHYLPILDFSGYTKGANITRALMGETNEHTSEKLANFCLFDPTTSNDVTFDILSHKGYTFLLTVPSTLSADDGCCDRINDLYDFCNDHEVPFYMATSSTGNALNQWIDNTGAAYPTLLAEDTELNTMVRSNPGLLLLKNGVIVEKWSKNNLPEIDDNTQSIESLVSQNTSERHPRATLLLWFICPFVLIVLLDTLYSKYRHNKNISKLNVLKTQKIMRKKIVAGNWKMNKNLQEGVALAKELNEVLAADKPNCGVIICTPFIHLASVANIIDSNIIGLGAENCADKVSGAYTGEVSAEMVKSTGANYVILGHSERRAYYNETPEILKEKVKLALANNLDVIFCIGEVLEDREAGKQNEVVKAQLEGSLFDLTAEEFSHIILAYEPVWAIGTGKTATADQAEEMHAFIRSTIADKFGAEAAENVSILYGGSCKPSNAKEIFSKVDVDGGLIGGAALKAADFKGIIDAWKA